MFLAGSENGGKVAVQDAAEAHDDDAEVERLEGIALKPRAATEERGAGIGRLGRRRRDVIGGRIGLASRNRRRRGESRFSVGKDVRAACLPACLRLPCALPACLPGHVVVVALEAVVDASASASALRRP